MYINLRIRLLLDKMDLILYTIVSAGQIMIYSLDISGNTCHNYSKDGLLRGINYLIKS